MLSIFGGPTPLHRVIEEAAERHPGVGLWLDRPLSVAPEQGTSFTYASFARLVVEASGWLHAAGVRDGDTVAIVKANGLDVLILGCAASRLGAVTALILPDLEPQRCVALLKRLDQPYIVADQAAIDTGGLRELDLTRLPHTTIVVDSQIRTPGTVPLQALRGAPIPPPASIAPDRPVLMTHTSGTTGTPKLALHSTETLNWHIRPQVTFGRLLGIKGPVGGYVAYTHVRGFTGLLAGMRLGVAMAIATSPEPRAARDLFLRVRPTYIETYPNVYLRWEELGRDPGGPLANVQYFFSTFDALHPRSIRNMLAASHRRMPLFVQVYGQSELGPVTMNASTRWTARHIDGRCVGFPLPGFAQVRLVDPGTGNPVGHAGQPGRIQVRSGARCLTYFGETERAADNTSEGWWGSGDIGVRSRFGCVHLFDREVEWDPRVGSALRIEDRLLDRLHGLTEAVVLPQSDGRAVPVVATRDDVPLDDAAWQYATRDLGMLAEPVHLRWDDIPRTPTTKVRRAELQQRLQMRDLHPVQV